MAHCSKTSGGRTGLRGKLKTILDSDSKFRAFLGLTAVGFYFGPSFVGLLLVIFGFQQISDSREIRTVNDIFVLGIGPIVGAVVGYYFGGSTNIMNSNEKRLVALLVTIFFFFPIFSIAILYTFDVAGNGDLDASDLADDVTTYLVQWIVYSGPITGVVYGSYFSAKNDEHGKRGRRHRKQGCDRRLRRRGQRDRVRRRR